MEDKKLELPYDLWKTEILPRALYPKYSFELRLIYVDLIARLREPLHNEIEIGLSCINEVELAKGSKITDEFQINLFADDADMFGDNPSLSLKGHQLIIETSDENNGNSRKYFEGSIKDLIINIYGVLVKYITKEFSCKDIVKDILALDSPIDITLGPLLESFAN